MKIKGRLVVVGVTLDREYFQLMTQQYNIMFSGLTLKQGLSGKYGPRFLVA